MIKTTSDFNKQRIKELDKKFTLKDAMKFRSNIRFYKQDDIPSKKSYRRNYTRRSRPNTS